MNFFLALFVGGDKKAFDFVSGNLYGVSLRRMKMITEKRRPDLFSGLSNDEIIDLIIARISQTCMGRKEPKSRVALTLGIDATFLMKAYQVSTGNHAIVGGASRNDFIPVYSLSK